jgi:hypothetical protein
VRAERARAAAAARADALTVLEARASLREDPTRAAARLKTLSAHAAPSVWIDAQAVAVEAESLGVARDVLPAHGGEVHGVAFTPDGATVVTASYDRRLRFWQPASGELRVLTAGAELGTVDVARDGRVAAGGADGELRVFERDGRVLSLAGHRDQVSRVAVVARRRDAGLGGRRRHGAPVGGRDPARGPRGAPRRGHRSRLVPRRKRAGQRRRRRHRAPVAERRGRAACARGARRRDQRPQAHGTAGWSRWGADGRVVVWNLAGGEPQALETGDELKDVAATADGASSRGAGAAAR